MYSPYEVRIKVIENPVDLCQRGCMREDFNVLVEIPGFVNPARGIQHLRAHVRHPTAPDTTFVVLEPGMAGAILVRKVS